jgi:TRAP-type C4-dicarboxylate transport system permease large subunit
MHPRRGRRHRAITVIAVEIGLLTPPFGLSVYTVRSTLADSGIGLFTIFRGTAPFVGLMFLTLAIVIAFRQLSLMFR